MGAPTKTRQIAGRGPSSASFKYDVLTALGAWACAGDRHRHRAALRLMVLITARYNWQSDTLATGQREMATLWNVDERTVKRQMSQFRDLGWLVVKRPAARGRVASYRLGLEAITATTAPHWEAVGPDYVARMRPTPPEAAPEPPIAPSVVPFPVAATGRGAGQGAWARVAARLQAEDPALFAVWFAPLVCRSDQDGCLELLAPSRFHETFLRTHHQTRLEAAARVEGFDVVLSAGPDSTPRG